MLMRPRAVSNLMQPTATLPSSWSSAPSRSARMRIDHFEKYKLQQIDSAAEALALAAKSSRRSVAEANMDSANQSLPSVTESAGRYQVMRSAREALP